MCITFYKFHVPVTFELTQLSHMKRTGHDEFATALCKQHKLDIGIEFPVSLSRAPFLHSWHSLRNSYCTSLNLQLQNKNFCAITLSMDSRSPVYHSRHCTTQGPGSDRWRAKIHLSQNFFMIVSREVLVQSCTEINTYGVLSGDNLVSFESIIYVPALLPWSVWL